MGRGQKIGIFRFSRDQLAMHHGRQVAMGTRQTIGVHTGAGGQCANTVETGVGADGLACILHTGMGSGAFGGGNAERGCLRNARLGGQNG